MPQAASPSGDRLLLIAVLAAAGVANGAYLTWQWYAHASASWCDIDPFWSCSKVRESPWSSIGGIPTATMGLVGFAALLVLSILLLKGVDRLGPLPTERGLFFLAILGVLLGAGLTIVEVVVIGAVCLLCLVGFALALAILGLSALPARNVRMSGI